MAGTRAETTKPDVASDRACNRPDAWRSRRARRPRPNRL